MNKIKTLLLACLTSASINAPVSLGSPSNSGLSLTSGTKSNQSNEITEIHNVGLSTGTHTGTGTTESHGLGLSTGTSTSTGTTESHGLGLSTGTSTSTGTTESHGLGLSTGTHSTDLSTQTTTNTQTQTTDTGGIPLGGSAMKTGTVGAAGGPSLGTRVKSGLSTAGTAVSGAFTSFSNSPHGQAILGALTQTAVGALGMGSAILNDKMASGLNKAAGYDMNIISDIQMLTADIQNFSSTYRTKDVNTLQPTLDALMNQVRNLRSRANQSSKISPTQKEDVSVLIQQLSNDANQLNVDVASFITYRNSISGSSSAIPAPASATTVASGPSASDTVTKVQSDINEITANKEAFLSDPESAGLILKTLDQDSEDIAKALNDPSLGVVQKLTAKKLPAQIEALVEEFMTVAASAA